MSGYALAEYEATALVYDGIYEDGRSRAENAIVKRALRRAICDDSRVLEFACGTGLMLDLIGHDPDLYLGLDASPSMLGVARSKHPRHAFEVEDMNEYAAWAVSSSDVVVCLFALGYADDLTYTLRCFRDYMASSGRLVATVPTMRRKDESPYPQRCYLPMEVETAAIQAGLRYVRLSGLSASTRTVGPLTRLLVEWERVRGYPLAAYQHVLLEAVR